MGVSVMFKGLLRTFAAAYVFKTTIALAGPLMSGKLFRRPRQVLADVYGAADSVRFAQMLTLMSFLYKVVHSHSDTPCQLIWGGAGRPWCAPCGGGGRRTPCTGGRRAG